MKSATQIWASVHGQELNTTWLLKKKTQPETIHYILSTTEDSKPLEALVNKMHSMNAITPVQRRLSKCNSILICSPKISFDQHNYISHTGIYSNIANSVKESLSNKIELY